MNHKKLTLATLALAIGTSPAPASNVGTVTQGPGCVSAPTACAWWTELYDSVGNGLGSTLLGGNRGLDVYMLNTSGFTVSGNVTSLEGTGITGSGAWAVILQDNLGNGLTSTLYSSKRSLDVNVANTGPIPVSGTVAVTGVVTVTGTATASEGAGVSGSTSWFMNLQDHLGVGITSTLISGVFQSLDVHVANTAPIPVTGTVSINGSVTVTGAVTINGVPTVTGNVTAAEGFGLTGSGAWYVNLQDGFGNLLSSTSVSGTSFLNTTPCDINDVCLNFSTPSIIAGTQNGSTSGTSQVPLIDSGGNVHIAGADPCIGSTKLTKDFVSTSSSGIVVAGVNGERIYVCFIRTHTSAATNISLIEGTAGTSGCVSGTPAGVYMNSGVIAASGAAYGANEGDSAGSSNGTIAQTATTGQNLCPLFTTAGSPQVNIHVAYVQQ